MKRLLFLSVIFAGLISYPSGRPGKIHFSVSAKIDVRGTDYKTTWDPDKSVTDVSVDLPSGVYSGKSVTILL